MVGNSIIEHIFEMIRRMRRQRDLHPHQNAAGLVNYVGESVNDSDDELRNKGADPSGNKNELTVPFK